MMIVMMREMVVMTMRTVEMIVMLDVEDATSMARISRQELITCVIAIAICDDSADDVHRRQCR